MKDKLKALLARVEATRSTLDGAVAELEELEQELKVLINGPNTWGAKHIAKSRGKMPAAAPKRAALQARVSEAAVEMQKRLDDTAVKHHGLDAPAELAAASGEAFVGLDGRVHYHDDDDLGVPF